MYIKDWAQRKMENTFYENDDFLFEKIDFFCKNKSGIKFLDLGCGSDETNYHPTEKVYDALPEDSIIYGLDIGNKPLSPKVNFLSSARY